MRDIDRFRGCIVGGAAGDALGYAVEFETVEQIIQEYGRRGITRFDLTDGVALFSDDTQMTLFTAAGLLHGLGGDLREGVRRSYIDWLATQVEDYPIDPEHESVSWLTDLPELFSPRDPGNTCLSALFAGGKGTVEEPLNNSRGCGGVMRAAPVGLLFAGDPDVSQKVCRLGAEIAAVTHGHELGWLPAAVLAHMVWTLASSERPDVRAALKSAEAEARRTFPDAVYLDSFCDLLDRAVTLADSSTSDLEAIRALGAGWVGDEALAIAVFCAARYERDFERALIAAVNHDGDSDSTGAVAGNLLGAAMGYETLPPFFKDDLEQEDALLQVAEDLHAAPALTPEQRRRYRRDER